MGPRCRQPRPSQREVRVFGYGPLEGGNGLRSVAGPVALDRLAYEAQSAQVVVVGPGIGGGHLGNGRDFWRGEPGLQRSRDPAGDLAFDAEDVVQGALVALGDRKSTRLNSSH